MQTEKTQKSWFTKEMGMTTLNQMGGVGRLQAFLGAYNFIINGKKGSVGFRFKAKAKNGINYCSIRLTPLDVYEVTFGRIYDDKFTVKKVLDMVYCDQLVKTFERETALYLHF